MSGTGMLLEFLQPALIPDDFDLLVKPEMTRVQCRVARRRALRIGVEVSRYIVSVRTDAADR